jgi:hypothetical protein
MSNFQLD